MSSEREDLQTSKLLYGWTTIIRIVDVHRESSYFKGQRYNITSSFWRVFVHNLTKKSRTSTEIGRNVVCAMDDIAYQLQGQ